MEDMIEQANEIQESLGRSYGVPDEVDEMDLQAELDALALDDDPIGEGETPSYLTDSQALPDFVDTAPVEEHSLGTPTAEVAR
jgi:charged multivesicular body protein 5